ncbi:hypothetical protein CAPTEDRAFT_94769, partial [Capitella teleta]
DVDECSNAGVCESGCEDTIGSFVCTCADGYQLSEDQVHCEGEKTLMLMSILLRKLMLSFPFADIHECEVFNGGCSHTCVEEEGGYYCSCPYDHRLNQTDSRTCYGEIG